MDCTGFLACAGSIVGSDWFRSLSFLLGVTVAVISVLTVKATAKRKQSADLLFASRADKELMAGMRCLAAIHERADSNVRAYARKDQVGTDEAKSIRYVLNHWEYVSVGVQAGIYDEKMLWNASYNTLVGLHRNARPFIDALREASGRSTLFQEVQWLAERWDYLGPPIKKKSKFTRLL
ncbi:DUF4760 domain-containing protein [Pseudomonas sp. HR96]|uniref:DUF4760 domain-containing protein n=1 Tax=Pseudomonas sp. HR96 TaxID=1027966 RepID=UPI002A76329B|nr:DUF4760 domain-containing protein [Pseudomonas sp. HR96]WPP00558.1 DUF4760 domain-containing protein [Pseudomonas sp. HR96]